MKEKKSVVIVALVLVLFSLEIAAAADVAYIYRRNFRVDENILQAFNNSGLSVQLINEANLPSNFNNFKMIFVGDENFRNAHRIPVERVPTIVANYYHGEQWGLTDNEGVSQLAGNYPLSVLVGNRFIQVYTSAKSDPPGGVALSYYYLAEENKAPGLTTVALTETTASGADFGDVIAYGNPGIQLLNGKTLTEKMCYFGIIESDFWTNGGRQLFNECLGFVAAECSTNSDCSAPVISGAPFCMNGDVYRPRTSYECLPSQNIPRCVPMNDSVIVEDCLFGCENGTCLAGIHDVALVDFTGAINKIQIRNLEGENVGSNLMCNQQYDITVRVSNLGNFSENVTFQGEAGNISFSHTATQNFAPGQSLTKTQRVNFNLAEGNYTLDVEAIIPEDDFLGNNFASREIFVSCPVVECYTELDCGVDGFIGESSCAVRNVTRNFQNFTCNFQGTVDSFCSSSIEPKVIEMCSGLCENGMCVPAGCDSDDDCDDLNPLTSDSCLNPGTPASVCVNTPINCASNSDCGLNGFIGEEFCSVNATQSLVAKNFQTSTCNNPGTTNSSCTIDIRPQLVSECQYACFDGACIRCDENLDCNDGNSATVDICSNPGTTQSFCSNTPPSQTSCSFDSDCGSRTVVSGLFCSGDNVNQLVQTWRCNNPGASNSYCSSNVANENVQTCSDICSNGQCQSIRCFTDSQCNDNIASTSDVCRNPGTTQSFCSNDLVNVRCSTNSDCGADGIIASNICFGDSLTAILRTYSCHNPGTSNSYCSSSVSQSIIQQCANSCSAGQCVGNECTPGTTQSCGLTDVGQCKLGTQTCGLNGAWGACDGAVYPSEEMCDGQDNDCDGENNEENICQIVYQCSDGTDNDGDGLIDYPSDPGCISSDDSSEFPVNLPPAVAQCNDGVDNDGDSFTDYPADRGCDSINDNSEFPVNFPPIVKQCDDGIDNDSDGAIDYPADSGCDDRLDNLEAL